MDSQYLNTKFSEKIINIITKLKLNDFIFEKLIN